MDRLASTSKVNEQGRKTRGNAMVEPSPMPLELPVLVENSVLVEDLGGVRRITLNRPDKLNSFNTRMHESLRAALIAASADPLCRAVLLTGAGRGFCAGQDLSERTYKEGDPPRDLGATLEQFYNPLIRLIRGLEKPVICAVNGVAAGAGANIAFACDIVLAAKSARFIQAFTKIGLIPDAGGTYMLPRLVGEARAKALVLLAEPVGADEAERIGLIYRAVDDSALAQTALALATSLAEGPTRAFAEAKMLIQNGAMATLEAQLDAERDAQRRVGASSDYREGVQAFIDKRKARFRGE